MNVKKETIEENVVKLEITVESSKFNEAMKKAFVKNAKSLIYQVLERARPQ